MRSARNIYKDDVDFTTLALQSPDFAKFVKLNGQLDFSDPEAVRQLTKSLLKRDFNLKVDIPENRLCPPVPNRLNYILWIQDLLDTTGDEYRDDYDPDRNVVDIDNDNIHSSKETVKNNGLESRIRIVKTDPADGLIPLHDRLGVDRLDFTMCNPPFYASRDELISSAEAKERPPFSACTGAEIEMVTGGGEVAFVSRMIEESLELRESVVWYTSMLGKLSSVSVLVEKLIELKNHNYAVTEFVQGNKTKRWAIAWSWADLRPSVNVARSISNFPKHLLPFPSEYVFEIPAGSIDAVSEKLDTELSSLPVQWLWRKNLGTGVGFAMENVWSRQARRKMQGSTGQAHRVEIDEAKAALGFKVQAKKEGIEDKGVRVVVRWLKGTDSVLFESFCGMLKRKAEGK
ncbi:DUF890 domain protein [Aspergillus affinis]|uniref:DUF890 domain protein n=1 Tax=Aspergillus affinis TaxID=1070780 RepID=UPI0022FDD9C6|nr:DUF890 domain protein [Aspergillus affinis]KAI9037421.1 DUF890 domain protein [Aspergillus affinis]